VAVIIATNGSVTHYTRLSTEFARTVRTSLRGLDKRFACVIEKQYSVSLSGYKDCSKVFSNKLYTVEIQGFKKVFNSTSLHGLDTRNSSLKGVDYNTNTNNDKLN
jgi:hypothetical protein